MVGSSGVVRENEGGMGRVMSRSVNDGTKFPISNSNYDTNQQSLNTISTGPGENMSSIHQELWPLEQFQISFHSCQAFSNH